jgi:hypothetical protein
MKIRLLECVAIKGRPTAAGTVVDVPDRDAASLIRRRMAEQSEEGPPPDEGTFLDATADPAPEPKRRNRR